MTTTSNYPFPEVLVAIMNNQRDLEIARTQHWYRIPVKSANRLIRDDIERMQYLAFYQTKVFKRDAFAVNHYAEIERISTALRIKLLPDEAGHQNVEALYYKLGDFPTTTFIAADSKQTPTARHFHYDNTREIQYGAGD